MGQAKSIIVSAIDSQSANKFVRRKHYSGKVVSNSQLHFGVFLNDRMHGVMSYGPSLDKGKMVGLVRGTSWTGFLELNRMAFDEVLPRNSESRALAISFKLIRKFAPHIKWIVTFADATQCGDGTIYRAAGFDLIGIKRSKNLARLPSGDVLHKMTVESSPTRPLALLGGRSYADILQGQNSWKRFCGIIGANILEGFQLKYIKFLDPTIRDNLTIPILPFSEIDKCGIGMYKGERKICALSDTIDTSTDQVEEDGAIPISALQFSDKPFPLDDGK